MCLAQGYNAVPPVRLEPVALRSRTKHSRYHYGSLCHCAPQRTPMGIYISLYIGLLTYSVFDYRTHKDNVNYRMHQDNVGCLVEVNVQYRREREF